MPPSSPSNGHRWLATACTTIGLAAGIIALEPVSAQAHPATPVASPLPSIADRYARADRYLRSSLDRLIVDGNLRVAFTADDRSVIYRHGPADHRQIVVLDVATGQSRLSIDERRLSSLLAAQVGKTIEPGRLSLANPAIDTGTSTLSFDAFGKRWAFSTDGVVRPIGAAPSDGDDAVSPDGHTRIVARGFNLYAVDVASGREIALTKDGTRDQPYGRGIAPLSDILEQNTEDPVLPVSVRWSPDSRRILTWRLDTRGVDRLSLTQENPPGRLYPRSFHYIYPTAGAATLPQASRMVINVAAALRTGKAKIVPIAVPAESLLYPADPDTQWAGDRIRAQWTERGYGSVVVYDIDPATGTATVVAREAMKPLVTVTSSFFQPAPELGGELDVSERSGWAQLYLVRPDDPDGAIPLTRGEWEVVSIDHVDAVGRSVLLTGVGREPDRNPYDRALYRVTLDGSQPRLLTPEPLDHETTVSGDGRWAIDEMSTPTEPTRTVLRDTADGHIVAELGRADPSALLATGYTPPEPFRGVAADGHTPLYAMIYRPAGFDPARRYPVIDNVYTGPTTTQVPRSWWDTISASPTSVAQLGAVVVMIDGRGTSRRGQAFRLPAYRNLGEVGLDDHIAMIRQIAARYPYIDVDRAGVYGCSAGGYDAARFILRRPQFFKVAVASSGNHDLRLDKAWWPEVSMGNADSAVWERNANMSVAGNLRGKLLLTHGDVDANVPVTETLRLAQAIIDAKRDVDVVILPNAGHCAYTPYFWRKFRDYFTANLLGEAPPSPTAGAPIMPPIAPSGTP